MSQWPSDELLDEARRSLEPTSRWRLFGVTKEGLDKANRDVKAWVASQRAKAPTGNADSEGAEQAESAGKHRRRRLRARQSAGPEQIEAWAREQGLKIGERGRLSQAILDRYRDAHRETPGE